MRDKQIEDLKDYKYGTYNNSIKNLINNFLRIHLDGSELVYSKNMKVNLDKENNAISFIRNNLNPESTYYRHIGIYAYRKNTLNLFTSLTQSDNEKNHRLEQLRALDNNIAIKLLISDFSHRSIDVKEDLKNYEN